MRVRPMLQFSCMRLTAITQACRETAEARQKREEEEAAAAAAAAEAADLQERDDFAARLRDRDLEERARRRGGKHVEEEHEGLADKLDLQNKAALVGQLRVLSEQVYLEKRQEKELTVRGRALRRLLWTVLPVCMRARSAVATLRGSCGFVVAVGCGGLQRCVCMQLLHCARGNGCGMLRSAGRSPSTHVDRVACLLN